MAANISWFSLCLGYFYTCSWQSISAVSPQVDILPSLVLGRHHRTHKLSVGLLPQQGQSLHLRSLELTMNLEITITRIFKFFSLSVRNFSKPDVNIPRIQAFASLLQGSQGGQEKEMHKTTAASKWLVQMSAETSHFCSSSSRQLGNLSLHTSAQRHCLAQRRTQQSERTKFTLKEEN